VQSGRSLTFLETSANFYKSARHHISEDSALQTQVAYLQTKYGTVIKLYKEAIYISIRSRNCSVGIATGYGLDDRGSIPGWGKISFSTPQRPDRLQSKVNQGLLAGVKRPKCEADHSHSSSAELKNCGAIPPLHHTSSLRDA
jgi:hypothetical protein